jgi:2-dehydro-3-deoxygluconokinase
MKTITDRMAELKVIPVVTLEDPEDAVPLAEALVAGGIPAAEVTFRTESAFQSIQAISKAFPEMLVGAGTVLTPGQVDSAVDAGAKFIVSPGLNPETVRYCQKIGIPIFPGCVTASEVQKAIELGLNVLKFFPAEQSGGLGALKALSAPFPQIRWMPTGGINLNNIGSYLGFPKILACGGSYMVGKADIKAKNWDKITELCRQTIRLIRDESEGTSVPPASKVSEKKAYDLVALGESLLRMSAAPNQRICSGGSFTAFVGGSELNVCSGLARLGGKAGFVSCLPGNDIGRFALHEIQRMGVGSELISIDSAKDARLGVYYSEGGASPRKPKVVYDRSHSSVSKLDLSFLPQSIYSDTKIFHTTGITLALPAVRNTAIEAIRRFHAGGALISFDVNYRANLWDEQTARQTLTKVFPYVDILFLSEESSRRMFRKTGSLPEIMKGFASEFNIKIIATSARTIISEKEHSWNSTIYSAEKDKIFTDTPYSPISVIDRIGSGDAFDAGVLYGLLACQSEQKMVDYGNAMAALKCTVPGDLPDFDREDVEALLELHKNNDQSEMIR